MHIRILYTVFAFALLCLPAEARDVIIGAVPVVPDFDDGTWEIQKIERWPDDPAFTATYYVRFKGTIVEKAMSLRHGDYRSPEILKSWGGVESYAHRQEGLQEGYNALLLDTNTWAISTRGKPYTMEIDRLDGIYFIVISVITDQGMKIRVFRIKHAL